MSFSGVVERELRIQIASDDRAGAVPVGCRMPKSLAVVPLPTSWIERLPDPPASETSSPVDVIETLTWLPAGGLASISCTTSPTVCAPLRSTMLVARAVRDGDAPLGDSLPAVEIGQLGRSGDDRIEIGRALDARRKRAKDIVAVDVGGEQLG